MDDIFLFNSPTPPAPLQPLDCNQLNTCPTEECEVVPTSLNSQDSNGQSKILFVDYVYVQGPSQWKSGYMYYS